jgi:uroporphyrin-III C-methyltransferase/precorrin-2 dehydrogenase/sirohydrochlorin ferrochelatase
MDYLPIFANVKGRCCLVVGGGDVAWRKTRMLLNAGAKVRLVSPELGNEFAEALPHDDIHYLAEPFIPEHLDGVFLVIAATDKREVNGLVYQSANQRQILVNVVDDTPRCSFIVPSIVDRSPLIVAISSSGKAPVLARLVREKLETLLPQSLGKMAALSGQFRDKLKTRLPNVTARRRFWESAFSGRFAQLVEKGQEQAAKDELERLSHNKPSSIGEVALIGAGPGDPGLLTLRALQVMQQADVVLYDYLVSPEILDLVRRDADLECVGKKAGYHHVSQEETNARLVKYAQAGKRVVRLKGGDPFMFGRGAEELEVLAKANIPFQVVPGITAAAGATAYAGIPLTHRGVSQGCTLVTVHAEKDLDIQWQALATLNHTLVFYMGLSKVDLICQQLARAGLGTETPAAIIEKGCTDEQRLIKATLATLTEQVKHHQIGSPALIIIGEVVSLSDSLAWYQPQIDAVMSMNQCQKRA